MTQGASRTIKSKAMPKEADGMAIYSLEKLGTRPGSSILQKPGQLKGRMTHISFCELSKWEVTLICFFCRIWSATPLVGSMGKATKTIRGINQAKSKMSPLFGGNCQEDHLSKDQDGTIKESLPIRRPC